MLGKKADPNVCPNCGRFVNENSVEPGRLAIGSIPSEIAQCDTLGCSASLARLIYSDGERGAWSAVVAATDVK